MESMDAQKISTGYVTDEIPPGKPQAAVEGAVAALHEEADSLAKRTSLLEERLGGVLRPAVADTIPNESHAPTGVPLADHLLGIADHLNITSARLNELFQRVEL